MSGEASSGEKAPDLDLMRDRALVFPAIAAPSRVRSARVWYCKYRTLASLAGLRELEVLLLAGVPDSDLSFLEELPRLRHLSIVHLPKVRDLEPIGSLGNLEVLSLATSPAWDASGKVLEVASLDPIARLPRLEQLALFGVVPPGRTLATLARCKTLRSARFSRYPEAEVTALRQATGDSDAGIAAPDF